MTDDRDYAEYAKKYKECRLCGVDADCGFVDQITGLCMTCTCSEEYYEHEQRVSGRE